jgi:hypothetical protein
MANVPNAPGVPALATGLVAQALTLLGADAPGLSSALGPSQWGLFLNGQTVVTAESVVAFGFRKSFAVLSYPIEEGSFQNFNKVQRPFDGRLSFSTGGSVADKQALVSSIDAAISSLQLFDIVTPEVIYPSVSAIEMSYDRRAMRGLGLLTVDVMCKQIRLTAQTAFSTTSSASSTDNSSPSAATRGPDLASPITSPADPGASPQVNDGTVQPVTPTTAQSDAFSNAMPLP